MAKLPKFSDFTDVSGLMNKVKSAFDNLTGPGSAAASEEALAKETNPAKAKLLEIELLINQIHDLQVLQNKAINDLSSKYADMKKSAEAALIPQENINIPPVAPTIDQTTDKETPKE